MKNQIKSNEKSNQIKFINIFYIFHWQKYKLKTFLLVLHSSVSPIRQDHKFQYDRTIKVGIHSLLAYYSLHSPSPPQSNARGICEARSWVPRHCDCFACWFCGIRASGCKLLFCRCPHSLLDSRRHFKALSWKDSIPARSAHRVFRPFLLGCSSLRTKTKYPKENDSCWSKSWNLQHTANTDFILHICTPTVCTCTNKKDPELHLRLRWLRTRLFFSNSLQHIYRFYLEDHDHDHDHDTRCKLIILEQHGRKLPLLRLRHQQRPVRLLTSIS